MFKKSPSFWYGFASLLAVVMLWSGGARLYATWKGGAGWGTPSAAIAAFAAPAQERTSPASPEGGGESGEKPEERTLLQELFRWFNFLLIVGGLGYLIKKLLVPFLEERGRLIREDMDRSAKALVDADQRLAAVEDRLKSLDEEMASLRQAAFHESVAERERVEKAAAADAGKVLAAAEQEIEAAVKAARQELKLYISELALEVAEKKIRASLTPPSEQRILRAFVQELAGGSGSGNGKAGLPSPNKQE